MGVLDNIGSVEILVIALIIVLLFGGRKVGELARGLGEGKKELKKIKKEVKGADESESSESS